MVENPVKYLIQLFCRLIIVKTEVLFLKNKIFNKKNAWNGSGRQYRHFHFRSVLQTFNLLTKVFGIQPNWSIWS